MQAVIECEQLNVRFRTDHGELAAVADMDFTLNAGECLGVVGESGSGKSQTFMAMFGLLASNGTASGSLRYRGTELLNAPRAVLDTLRGNRLAMIFQDALSGLTPTMRVGDQMAEVLMRHKGLSRRAARDQSIEALEMVRIADAPARYSAYPFEMSGGMRQRVMIALSTLCQPEVLIADEPTTALDVTVQAQILRLLNGLKQHTGTSLVMITHDLGVVAGLCDRVLIMYAGRAVEHGPVREIFERPAHPYTAALLRSMPSLAIDPTQDLPVIPGQPPDLEALPAGCAFASRCSFAFDRCLVERPLLRPVDSTHSRACHLDL
ncbi:MAG: ABC transporter ATP-binding protein [Gammaproteobacteria bacterium]